MTDKVTLAAVGSLIDATTAATTINSNMTAIVTAVNNTLSRDGTQPNQMNANLDMNSNRILNLPAPISGQEPLRLTDLNLINGLGPVNISPLPTGGTVSQALTKNSGTNYDVSWTNSIPVGGTTGQILSKNSATNYDTSWSSLNPAAGGLPTGGTAGQTLVKNSSTNFDTSWTSTAALSSNTYTVENYGALADFKTLFDGSIAVGTGVFHSTSAPFVLADVGKLIIIAGAGPAGGPLATSISGFTSSSQVSIGATASVTVTSGGTWCYSTDSTIGIQAACNLAKVTGGEVVFSSAGMYGITSLNCTNPTRSYRLKGCGPTFWGTRLVPMSNVSVVLDASGHDAFSILNISIGGSNGQLARPATGLLMAPTTLVTGMDVPFFENFRIDGFFTIAGAYFDRVFGGQCTNCTFLNYYQLGSPGGVVSCMLTKNNTFSLTSPYATLTSGAGPNLNWVFNRCEWHSIDPLGGAGVSFSLWLDGLSDSVWNGGLIAGGYVSPIQFGVGCVGLSFIGVEFSNDNPGVGYNYVFSGNTANYIALYNCNPAYHIALQGTSPVITNLIISGRT